MIRQSYAYPGYYAAAFVFKKLGVERLYTPVHGNWTDIMRHVQRRGGGFAIITRSVTELEVKMYEVVPVNETYLPDAFFSRPEFPTLDAAVAYAVLTL